MQNRLGDSDLELGRFGEYLLRGQLASEKNRKFYVHWVRKFLGEAPEDPGKPLAERMDVFLQGMKSGGAYQDWQVEQAERALRLYFHNFQNRTEWKENPAPRVVTAADGSVNAMEALAALRDALRIKHYSYRTEGTYTDWAERFFKYLADAGSAGAPTPQGGTANRATVTPQKVKDFLAWLALRRHVSASTQNQAFNALLFLCREVLKVELGDLQEGVRAKRGRRLPMVLSQDEVQALFRHLRGRARLMAQVIYGGGLRVMECCRLRVKDLDFENNLVFVRSGKGDKDRSTLLAESAKEPLRVQLAEVKKTYEKDRASKVGPVWMPNALAEKYPQAGLEWAWQWLFPSPTLSTDPRAGVVRRHHVSDMAVQRAVHDAAREAAIPKPVSVHTLRHTFATQLLLHGVDIRQIQDYLGHSNVETTMIYTHVVKELRTPATSPLDMMGGMTAEG